MDVERNEVEISKLFNWGKVFELVGNDDTTTLVYMRILGDADINKARVYALRKSAELRKALKNTDSDEYMISVKDFDDLTVDNLVNLVIVFSTREITQNMWKTVKIKSPKPPKSDASLEELEKYQKDIDEFPKKREKAIQDAMEKELKVLDKSLRAKTKEELYKQYLSSLVNELCEQRVLQSFKEISTYLGCYKDDEYKDRFFESLDEFLNLETEQKLEFMRTYQMLEVGTEEIKKLREAML